MRIAFPLGYARAHSFIFLKLYFVLYSGWYNTQSFGMDLSGNFGNLLKDVIFFALNPDWEQKNNLLYIKVRPSGPQVVRHRDTEKETAHFRMGTVLQQLVSRQLTV